jgi:hypothetical protein
MVREALLEGGDRANGAVERLLLTFAITRSTLSVCSTDVMQSGSRST